MLTHANPDHVGFAGERQSGAHGTLVYVHLRDRDQTRQGKTRDTEGSPLAMAQMLRHSYARRALRQTIADGSAQQPKVAELIPFDDQDELEVPGRLRAIHTLSPTDRHCVLYSSHRRCAVGSGAVYNVHILTGAPGAHVAPVAANPSTTAAYQSLAPVEELEACILYFGHGDPSTAGAPAVVAEAHANR